MSLILFFKVIFCLEFFHKIHAGSASQTNRTSRTSCNEDEIISNLADIQIINPESILSLAIDNSFSMCKDVAQTIQTLLKYVKECEGTLSENDLYVSLIRGLESMYKKMCENPDFLKEFDLYAECINELVMDFESCYGPPDWIEDENIEHLCRTYTDICDCYFIKTAKVCGMGAAQCLKELITTIFNSIIHKTCPYIQRNPAVEDAMPEKYVQNMLNEAESSVSKLQSSLFLILIKILLINYL